MSEIEFRFNFVARIATDVIWYFAQLSVFEVLFRHTSTINGWNLNETRVFMGALFVTDSLYMLFFSENLDRLGEKVRRGDLDLLIVKPVNSQWIVSLQKMSVAYLGNFFISCCWLTWAITQVETFSWWRVLYLPVAIPIGLVIVYSIRFMIASTALFFTRVDAVTYIWYQVYRLGTRPDTIYPTPLRYAVLSILPVGFLASVPARVLLGKTGPEILVLGGALAYTLLRASNWLWRRGLRSYSSASS